MALRRDKPITMHRTLADLPELEQFESDEQRDRALRQIELETGNPFSWDWVIGAAILVGTVLVVVYALRWLIPRIPVVNDSPRTVQQIVRLALTLVAFLVVLRWLHRWGAAEQVREKLIAAGVPVCRGCGYALKGLPADSLKCPECGHAIEADMRKLIDGGESASAIGATAHRNPDQGQHGD